LQNLAKCVVFVRVRVACRRSYYEDTRNTAAVILDSDAPIFLRLLNHLAASKNAKSQQCVKPFRRHSRFLHETRKRRRNICYLRNKHPARYAHAPLLAELINHMD